EVPCRPCSPNSSSATTRISSRLSSAVFRAVTAFTRWKLALTHNARQGSADAVLRDRDQAGAVADVLQDRECAASLDDRAVPLVAVARARGGRGQGTTARLQSGDQPGLCSRG